MSAQAVDFYLIGDNVNGNNWKLKDPTAMFSPTETDGVYTINVEILGTGFKINNGTWSDPNYNFGAPSTSKKLTVGEPYTYWANANSGNISLNGVTEVENATATLDTNAKTILVTGEGGGEIEWYVAGLNDAAYKLDDAHMLNPTDNENVFVLKDFVINQAGSFKVSTQNWMESYGAIEGTLPITSENLSSVLSPVSVDCEVPYSITGTYNITWNYNTKTVTFEPDHQSGVENVAADANGNVEYFNLQGVRVEAENLTPGLYIRSEAGRSSKVAIR